MTTLRHVTVGCKVTAATKESSRAQLRAVGSVLWLKLCDARTGCHSCPTPDLSLVTKKERVFHERVWCERGLKTPLFPPHNDETWRHGHHIRTRVRQKSKHASLRVRRGDISAFRHNRHQPAPALTRSFHISDRHFYLE